MTRIYLDYNASTPIAPAVAQAMQAAPADAFGNSSACIGPAKRHGRWSSRRARRGISDAVLRLSIGLEAAEDLIADLQQALG